MSQTEHESANRSHSPSDYSIRSLFSDIQLAPPEPSNPPTAMPQTPYPEPVRKQVNVADQPASVSKVSVSGISRIRPGFLNTLVSPVIRAQTVEQAIDEAREAAGKLVALGMAKGVAVIADADDGDQIKMHLQCENGPRYSISTGFDMVETQGTASVVGKLYNIWGGAENLVVSYVRGVASQARFRAVLDAPVLADPRRSVVAEVSQTLVAGRPHSSCDELRRTLALAYRVHSATSTHDFGVQACWRDVHGLGSGASAALRRLAGHSLKSSVSYGVVHDTRDSALVPTTGRLLRMGLEVAGLGGDARFMRLTGDWQANRQVPGGCVLAAGVRGGLLWTPEFGASFISDRFFLGGSSSVRGFEHRGIGPREGGDSLGGDVFYALGLSLLTPLPRWVPWESLRGHLWVNAGQCALLGARGLQDSRDALRFLRSPSVATGIGLVYRHSMVRAEVSLCLPLAATANDRPSAGVHFGLGLDFL
ncbi:hypothetical protein GGI07_004816 [Coemansia sp. Benny D115]|nr:hypothetical protein GGI07_004816 [Coemansia sp. Benny D115]